MKKIFLLPLACVGLATTITLVATPLVATAMNSSGNGQGVRQETTPLIAQYRRNNNRWYNNRRYTVYHRNPLFVQWILESSYSNRRDAQRAERRLQQRGHMTYTREWTNGNGGRGGYRDR